MARSSSLSLASALRLAPLYLLLYSIIGSCLPLDTQGTDSPTNEEPIFDLCGGRTVLSILWNSLATIFACIWFSVHQNVPGPKMEKKGWFYFNVLRHAELMVFTVFSPEHITIWALRQHSVARLIRALCPEKLSMSHGFLVSMGAFVDSDGCPITLEKLKQHTSLVKSLGEIKKKEIDDRDKGDGLSKAVAVGQATWFLLQCVARVAQHLPLTVLEIVAVGYAIFTIINYAVWWHKPLGISVPFRVAITSPTTLNTPSTPVNTMTSDHPPEGWKTPRPLPSLFPTSLDAEHLKDWVNFRLLSIFFGGDIIPDVAGPSSEEGVPRLWSGHPNNPRLFYIVACGNCIGVFGAIYCAAWHYPFVTSIERILWRGCSFIFMLAPPSAILLTFVVEKTAGRFGFNEPEKDSHLFSFTYRSLYILLWIVHDMARAFSLVEPFLALRHLPAGVLQDISWVSFFPHI
ncbi:uncharacterized protein EV420DRAFT_236355 [Desarmillaria tabescens]|uniref:Uncharacterized protein n=1 Tax=Armillaria tabescens TaxID=1929756 RepID=A0AA39J937_ARMTA|nr:uncharacterized protein EV420DRAFT_236355 [Desarmillaria tabescens]KAK0436483.1 hypothetical protein EV420DRAFT_236355 [Desarmillaria tabescens]